MNTPTTIKTSVAHPSCYDIIQEAKASLLRPTRPFTPNVIREKDKRRAGLIFDKVEIIARVPRRLVPLDYKKDFISNQEVNTSKFEFKKNLLKILESKENYPQIIIQLKSFLNDHNLLQINMEEFQSQEELIKKDYACKILNPYLTNEKITSNSESLISLCGILFKVSDDASLARVSQVLFNLSKSIENDKNIIEFNLIEDLKHIFGCFQKEIDHNNIALETIVFTTGVIKNLSNEEHNQKYLLKSGVIGILVKLLDYLLQKTKNKAFLQHISITSLFSVLAQISGTMRNIVSLMPRKKYKNVFLETNLVESLMKMISFKLKLNEDEELMLTCVRILSKLTLSEAFLERLRNNPKYIEKFMRLVVLYQQEKPIVMRVCFILGNLTNKLSTEHKYLKEYISDLISMLGMYCEKLLIHFENSNVNFGSIPSDEKRTKEEMRSTEEEEEIKETEDILIKLIRLVTNLSVDPEIGEFIVEMIELESLLHIFDAIDDKESHEELTLNITAALANFTFYSRSKNNCILKNRIEISKSLLPLLMSDNLEMVIKTARVYGNLSRFNDISATFEKFKVTELCTLLVDHSCRDIVYQTGGVLMNVSNLKNQRKIIILKGGFKNVDVLEKDIKEDGSTGESLKENIQENSVISRSEIERLLFLLEEIKSEQKIEEDSSEVENENVDLMKFNEVVLKLIVKIKSMVAL
ncbi:Armadillo repeat-containing protein 2 [Clydaea vesicula]|uniref:Armadillo repeat-containing protein 2 n=1 Tax=Clydaea vesicula TaxID=447962 RepID=A0AAD5U3K2_9FUNG|nr:Armadillo repeat-containing protein 2 [Clydaea vesicula]